MNFKILFIYEIQVDKEIRGEQIDFYFKKFFLINCADNFLELEWVCAYWMFKYDGIMWDNNSFYFLKVVSLNCCIYLLGFVCI